MPTSIQSPYSNILPFLSGIPDIYWKKWVVPNGQILMTGTPGIDDEYLYMMVHTPNSGTVSYTGDTLYPQFSEWSLGTAYKGQCAAFAKVVADRRSLSTDKWLPGVSLVDFCNSPEWRLPSLYQGMMIAYFEGKQNYALANPAKKHVAILLDILRDQKGNPTGILVVDQNYYSYAPYMQYTGKIAKHSIAWGKLGQKWVGVARSYHIVTIG
jgi:hypothetical protein